jgi:SpoVK/Ycf46/Vps4 family AAA+-type ATPase
LALRESIEAERVGMRHFREALRGVRPVSSPESMVRYVAFAEVMGHLK